MAEDAVDFAADDEDGAPGRRAAVAAGLFGGIFSFFVSFAASDGATSFSASGSIPAAASAVSSPGKISARASFCWAAWGASTSAILN